MNTCISILRGINVGGQKSIRMADLKTLFEELGFLHPQTYIQSGNVVFQLREPLSTQEAAQRIQDKISARYGFEVPVLVRTLEEMQTTLQNNPFLKVAGIDPDKLHVTFLAALPGKEKLEKLAQYAYPPDQFFVSGKEVYVHCPDKYGETKLSNAFFENKLGVPATTRNWKTVGKLLELALNA